MTDETNKKNKNLHEMILELHKQTPEFISKWLQETKDNLDLSIQKGCPITLLNDFFKARNNMDVIYSFIKAVRLSEIALEGTNKD